MGGQDSNLPESIGGSSDLRAAGRSPRWILGARSAINGFAAGRRVLPAAICHA